MINNLFANPSSKKLLANPHRILHTHSNYHLRENICFLSDPYQITVISSLAKANTATQYNYEQFIRTMAKMVQKYSDKI